MELTSLTSVRFASSDGRRLWSEDEAFQTGRERARVSPLKPEYLRAEHVEGDRFFADPDPTSRTQNFHESHVRLLVPSDPEGEVRHGGSRCSD